MRKISNEELITEFHTLNTILFPGITSDQAKEICSGPWNMLKYEMESGELSEVRFKYFGTFLVYPVRAQKLLLNLKERFKFNKVDKKEFFRLKEMLSKFIEKNETKN